MSSSNGVSCRGCPVEKEYGFATEDGPKSMPDLFDGRSQLLI